jgi:hypothetical protein
MVMNKRNRRVEKFEVLFVLQQPSRSVGLCNAERAVELRAVRLAPLLISFEHWLRVNRIFGLGMARVFMRDALGDNPLEIGERLVR